MGEKLRKGNVGRRKARHILLLNVSPEVKVISWELKKPLDFEGDYEVEYDVETYVNDQLFFSEYGVCSCCMQTWEKVERCLEQYYFNQMMNNES